MLILAIRIRYHRFYCYIGRIIYTITSIMSVLISDIKPGMIDDLSIVVGPKGAKEQRLLYKLLPEDKGMLVPYHLARTVYNVDNNARHFKKFDKVKMSGSLKPEQRDAYRDIKSTLDKYGSAYGGLHTGFGKTALGFYIVNRIRLRAVVVMYMDTHLTQWSASAKKFFPGMKVGIVGERGHDREYLLDCNVVLCMDRRVKKLVKMSIASRFGILIVDEVHAFATDARYQSLMWFRPRYSIAMSATPRDLTGQAFKVIEAIFGEVSDTGVVRKNVTKNVNLYELRTPFVVAQENNPKSGIMDFPKFTKDLLFKDDRNKMVADIVERLYHNKKSNKFLIITARVDHMHKMVEIFNERGLEVDCLGGKKSSYNDSRILVAVSQKIKDGFDEATFCKDEVKVLINTIFYMHTFKADVLREQLDGRSRSAEVSIYHIVDNTSTSEKHFRETFKNVYKKNGYKHNILDFTALACEDHGASRPIYKRHTRKKTFPPGGRSGTKPSTRGRR